MAFCASCGSALPGNAKFCPGCAAPANSAQPSAALSIGRMFGYIVIPLGLALLVYAVYNVTAKAVNNPQQRSFEQSMAGPIPRTTPIVNGALTVKAEGMTYYTFVVPASAMNVRVTGHFTASGGVGNDIIAYITDADGLANLQNGHQANVWYNSQKVTQSEITAGLPNPGTYYLIFDNRFSFITPKAVQANATLNYTQ